MRFTGEQILTQIAEELGVSLEDLREFLLTGEPVVPDPFVDDTQPIAVTSATGVYTESTAAYDSSIDSSIVNNQYAYCYDNGIAAANPSLLPVLVVMHGYADSTGSIAQATQRRLASYGFLVCVMGKRFLDASGREIHDILDGLADLRATLPLVAHPTLASIMGYSGGGGNVLACAHKCPDTFTTFVSYFGISDYGYDTEDGWWFTREGIRILPGGKGVSEVVGDRAEVIDPFRARDAVGSIAQTLAHGGFLYMFHDASDTDVTVANSDRVRDALEAAGLSNFAYARSTSSDVLRWEHGYPEAEPGHIEGEWRFVRRALGAEAWSMPPRGTIRVAGWHKNKRFEVWLGPTNPPRTELTGGVSSAADVEYDHTDGTYTITPLTSGTMFAQIIQADGRERIIEVDGVTELEINSFLSPADITELTDLSGCVLALRATAGITLVGADVSVWADQSGAGKNHTDTTNRPLFEASLDGYAAVTFDRANSERMEAAAILSDPNSDYTIVSVYKQSTVDSFCWSQCHSGSTNSNVVYLRPTNTTIIHGATSSTGGNIENAVSSASGAWHLHIARRVSDVMKLRTDGGVEDSDAAPVDNVANTDRSALGCLYDQPGQRSFSGGSWREFHIFNRALTEQELTTVRAFYQDRYTDLA